MRCLARDPSKIADLASAGCEVVQGDISDPLSLRHAMGSVEAVYISIHTLSAQQPNVSGQGYMDVEMNGLKNIVDACKSSGTRRLIYMSSMGTSQSSPSFWLRERWKEEQFLLDCGLDATVFRPGQIVGVGGKGFDMMIANAKHSFALDQPGSGQQKWQNIAVDDLVYYLVGVLDDPRTYKQAYNVGCDDILTYDEMVDVVADILGKAHPSEIHLPGGLIRPMAPVLERAVKLPKGSVKGIIDAADVPMTGDCMPIRVILSRPPVPYRKAVQRALRTL